MSFEISPFWICVHCFLRFPLLFFFEIRYNWGDLEKRVHGKRADTQEE